MANETKHTPAPWRYFRQGDGTRFHVTARKQGTPGNHFDDFAQVDIGHEADARLIAAAPEMLEALQEIASVGCLIKGSCKPPHICIACIAKAAAAKAEGRS